jgi:putative endonuclease
MSRGSRPQDLGRAFESRAAAYLGEQGIRIIAQGYRCRLGEIDLIGSDGRDLIFVEVRARGQDSLGSALESVGPAKQRRIVRATRHFLMRNPSARTQPIRFDVIAFDGIDSKEPRITWIRNAFDAA